MNKIKFRAWHKRRKFMSDVVAIHFDINQVALAKSKDGAIQYLWDMGDVELMQYIGIKDKNGRKIYVGDILATSNNNPEFDVWKEEDMGFSIVQKNKDMLGVSFTNWNIDMKDKNSIYYKNFVEVIGNIYENKNLLTNK